MSEGLTELEMWVTIMLLRDVCLMRASWFKYLTWSLKSQDSADINSAPIKSHVTDTLVGHVQH